eukprot:TRINITY_DN7879_c0_g1_i1.p1 TRINITY_DN7879_c0_g1~~TRINITY_DN7879_c0_g1_i1.p1  ORF type:complete len:310 (+),score=79.49 TRINITY_DN7879_c0_g1_i1:114-932(+)
MAVFLGLTQYTVARMQSTWGGIPPVDREKWSKLESLCSPMLNFKNLRVLHDKFEFPAVKAASLFTKDLTFMEDGNPLYIYSTYERLTNSPQTPNLLSSASTTTTTSTPVANLTNSSTTTKSSKEVSPVSSPAQSPRVSRTLFRNSRGSGSSRATPTPTPTPKTYEIQEPMPVLSEKIKTIETKRSTSTPTSTSTTSTSTTSTSTSTPVRYININRLQQISELLEMVHLSQTVKYELKPHPILQDFLLSVHHVDLAAQEEASYQNEGSKLVGI